MLLPDLPPPEAPTPTPVVLSLTHENALVEDGAHMGLLGLSYRRRFTPDWSGGVAVYSATTGTHGGFFGFGLQGAWHAPLERWLGPQWHGEAGAFAGGGGGSPGWVAGGLMLRSHAEISHDAKPFRIGLGVSRLVFKDGRARSTHPYLSVQWDTASFIGPAFSDTVVPVGAGMRALPQELAAIGGVYQPRKSPRRDGTGDTPALQYGGLAWRQGLATSPWLGAQPYASLMTLGAMGGGYDGYAELSGGLGLRWQMGQQWQLRAEGLIGSAGAGATVDTGGGLLAKAGAAAVWTPSPGWSMGAYAGLLKTRGLFSARELRLELGWQGIDWQPLPGGRLAIADAVSLSRAPQAALSAAWSPWAVSTSWKHYSGTVREVGPPQHVPVLGLKLERALTPNWRVLAEAGTAVGGMAGGYATGQLGAGWMQARQPGAWRWGAEASLGAAGGGNVDVNGGLFAQAQLQLRREFAPGWSWQLDAGQLRTVRGGLKSQMLGVSLVSEFGRLQAP